MTHREVYDGTNKLCTRRRLDEQEVFRRLCYFYTPEESREIIDTAKLCECCVDSDKNIVVIYNEGYNYFIIVATGMHYDLIT